VSDLQIAFDSFFLVPRNDADYEIGRIIETLEKLGELNNTLIIYVAGNNGPSAEGSLTRTVNELKAMQGIPESIDEMLKKIDELGGPTTHGHYPVGWAWAGSSPLKWMKQITSHFGGTRNGMVMFWPEKIKDAGGLRTQFHHAIDIVPTILEVAGICEPVSVNGTPQKPIEGISMVYTFEDAKAPSQRRTQYFEMFGNRALYNDGWVAAVRHGRLPWESGVSAGDFDDDTWELYYIDDDFSEANDRAKENPKKLRELQDLWWAEAGKYNVLPLDDRFIERADVSIRPSLTTGKTKFTYYAGTKNIPEGSAPDIKNKSFSITADVVIPEGGANGILVTQGGLASGWAFLLIYDKPTFIYNYFGDAEYVITSMEQVPEGKAILRFDFEKTGKEQMGAGGIGRIFINGRKVAEGRIDKTVPFRFSADETFDVGEDTGTPVSSSYQTPFKFTGVLNSLTVDLGSDHKHDHRLLNELRARFEKMRQ
jgi:arylsulfatase